MEDQVFLVLCPYRIEASPADIADLPKVRLRLEMGEQKASGVAARLVET
jgi:hypothetical protein